MLLKNPKYRQFHKRRKAKRFPFLRAVGMYISEQTTRASLFHQPTFPLGFRKSLIAKLFLKSVIL